MQQQGFVGYLRTRFWIGKIDLQTFIMCYFYIHSLIAFCN